MGPVQVLGVVLDIPHLLVADLYVGERGLGCGQGPTKPGFWELFHPLGDERLYLETLWVQHLREEVGATLTHKAEVLCPRGHPQAGVRPELVTLGWLQLRSANAGALRLAHALAARLPGAATPSAHATRSSAPGMGCTLARARAMAETVRLLTSLPFKACEIVLGVSRLSRARSSPVIPRRARALRSQSALIRVPMPLTLPRQRGWKSAAPDARSTTKSCQDRSSDLRGIADSGRAAEHPRPQPRRAGGDR